MHVIEMIYLWGRTTPEHPAIISPNGIISYARLAQSIEFASNYFEANISDKSSPVGVLIDTRSTMMVACLGLLHAGFTIVPLDPILFPNLGQVSAKTLVHERGSATLNNGTNIFFDEFLFARGAGQRLTRPKADDRGGVIFFSSGSTGMPKSFVFDQDRLRQQLSIKTGLPDYKRSMVLPGIANKWGFLETCQGFQAGKTICFSFLGEHALQMISSYNVDALVASTQQLLDLIELQEKGAGYTLPSLRAVSFGGSPLSPERILAAKSHICTNLISNYGTTEVGQVAIARIDAISHIPRAVGFVVPGAEVEIVDAAGVALSPGSEGFLRVRRRAPSNSTNEAGATDWFYSGDLGSLTVDGALCIAGRHANVLNRGGVKFDIDDFEKFLLSCSGVRDAAVYSPKNEPGMDRIWAALVLERTQEMSTLRRELEADLAYGSNIDKIFIVEAIPRGVLGKVQRDELAKLLQNITEDR
jgi:acyl-coenzyme A synthetase/AMP-(fatty) acid ligase